MKKIDTGVNRGGEEVEIDGKVWTFKMPGAGKELELSRAMRRVNFLEKKIKSGEYTEEDLDKYDELEAFTFDFFSSVYKDKTEDNSEVRDWVENTEMSIVIKTFNEIKEYRGTIGTPKVDKPDTA